MQDNNSVFFSIIIATKNRQYSINNTLKSLKDQTFKNFEVIVVNDYSDYEYKLDEKIISELNFKFLDNKYSAGRSAARNYALNFVEQSSQYYIFLDDDDYLDKTYLMNVYNKIIETSDCNIDIFYSNYQKIYLDFYEDNYREYKREYITTSEFDIELLTKSNFIPIITAVFNRRCFDKIRFSETFDCLEDWDLFLQAAYQNNFIFKKIDICGCRYCLRNDRTNSTFAEFDKFYEARKKILIKYQSFFDKFQEIKKLHLQYLATFENQYSEWVKVIELNGCKNLVIKDSNGREFLLHSKYNPILESQRQIAKFATDDNTLIILIGAGLGYKVQSLIETKDFYKIIVIEPDKYIFNAAQAIVYKKITNTDILYFVDLNLVDLIFELNAVFLTLPISVKKIKYSIFEPLKKNYENYLLKLEKYLISKFNAEKL